MSGALKDQTRWRWNIVCVVAAGSHQQVFSIKEKNTDSCHFVVELVTAAPSVSAVIISRLLRLRFPLKSVFLSHQCTLRLTCSWCHTSCVSCCHPFSSLCSYFCTQEALRNHGLSEYHSTPELHAWCWWTESIWSNHWLNTTVRKGFKAQQAELVLVSATKVRGNVRSGHTEILYFDCMF